MAERQHRRRRMGAQTLMTTSPETGAVLGPVDAAPRRACYGPYDSPPRSDDTTASMGPADVAPRRRCSGPYGVARHRRTRARPPGRAGARRLRPAARGRHSIVFLSVRAAGSMQPACPERPSACTRWFGCPAETRRLVEVMHAGRVVPAEDSKIHGLIDSILLPNIGVWKPAWRRGEGTEARAARVG